jgi:hypothetical protein
MAFQQFSELLEKVFTNPHGLESEAQAWRVWLMRQSVLSFFESSWDCGCRVVRVAALSALGKSLLA